MTDNSIPRVWRAQISHERPDLPWCSTVITNRTSEQLSPPVISYSFTGCPTSSYILSSRSALLPIPSTLVEEGQQSCASNQTLPYPLLSYIQITGSHLDFPSPIASTHLYPTHLVPQHIHPTLLPFPSSTLNPTGPTQSTPINPNPQP